MLVDGLSLRNFRGYGDAEIILGSGLTVVWGPNGAGKTNLLEALYFGCTGRSCRTGNEREVVRFGSSATRVVVDCSDDDGPHELAVGFSPGEPKRMRVDGAPVERLLDVENRPLISVFFPDRLELIKGAPALRRAHLDQFVAALWPTRVAVRRAFAQALAQRNALLARLRAGHGSSSSLTSWDTQFARHGLELMRDRRQAVAAIHESFADVAASLGLDGEPSLVYRPRSSATGVEEFVAELSDRVSGDLERGFTGHGPHRDDLLILRDGRDVRAFGSQGQQRLALLALLLSERAALSDRRGRTPLMLLDDVMSELDHHRREALVELLRRGGQSVITTTDLEHVPGAGDDEVTRLAISEGHRVRPSVALHEPVSP